jgi:hypothetical protein
MSGLPQWQTIIYFYWRAVGYPNGTDFLYHNAHLLRQ